MKLIEALRIAGRNPSPETAPRARFLFACGFTPLHAVAFLKAHLIAALPDRHVEINTGLYGDLAGSLERLDTAGLQGAAVIVEWPDLDPRLGLRQLGGWAPSLFNEIAASAEAVAGRLGQALERVADTIPVALCLPALALPPLGFTPGGQASEWELRVEAIAQELARRAAAHGRIRLVHAGRLAAISAPASRLDAKSDLMAGFPYTAAHAEAVSRMLAALLAPAAPKKGLITDLDDTMWAGILGEEGVEGVWWDLEHKAQIHGLYQQFLQSLSERGVLLGVASKNDAALAGQALGRDGLQVESKRLFPVEANWGPKSESIRRILGTWNVGADSVVFIDDSPMELAEVSAALPEVECIRFPKEDPAAVLELLETLRDRFGKPFLSAEDALRAESLRGTARLAAAAGGGQTPDAVLAALEAEVTFRLAPDVSDARALELVNKTNQFNLNGRRVSEAEWRERLADPAAVLLTVAYRDKFGPAGKIAVVFGKKAGRELLIDAWVLSCRVFSRRIEQQTLRYLFDKLDIEAIRFDFTATPRNGPLQELFAGFDIQPPDFILFRERFAGRCPVLFHGVQETSE